jgi:glycosyltransferase involved in cell wall biosynthesis
MESIYTKAPVICHLSDFSPEYAGSFVDALMSLSRHCRDRSGIQTMYIFPEQAKEKEWLKRFDECGGLYACVPRTRNVVFHLRKLLKNYEPIVFHAHFSTFDIAAVFAKLVFYQRSKVVWHFHSSGVLNYRQRVTDTIKVRLLARNFGNAFIAVGDEAYRYSLARGFPSDKVTLVYNAIDTARFAPNEIKRKHFRDLLGISTEAVVFLLLGWDPWRKGVDLFIKAADEAMRQSKSPAVFLIVGREESKVFVSSLSESGELHRALRVIDPIADFSSFLSAIDVFVTASRSEGLSYAVLEGMAAGKLILSSDIPGVSSTYGKAKGVWLFSTEDWKALALLMKKAKELSSAERDRRGELNSRYVAEYHSIDKWTDSIVEIYNRLLNGALKSC